MRRILFLILFLFIPLNVMAEECNEEQLKTYYAEAQSIKLVADKLNGTDTYRVSVSNLTNTRLSIERGKTQDIDGPFNYAIAGTTFIVNVYVSDGSSCSGKAVRTILLDIGKNESTSDSVSNGVNESTDEDRSKDNCNGCNDKISENDINPPIISSVEKTQEIIMEEDKNDNSIIDGRSDKELKEYINKLNDKIDETKEKNIEKKDNSKVTIISSLIIVFITISILFFIGRKKNGKKIN
ncbi:MAG TPA: hypothetical protein PLT65_00815 [Bacilli bacterium]|nr:hypothetical protein [Bacilli bacterium]